MSSTIKIGQGTENSSDICYLNFIEILITQINFGLSNSRKRKYNKNFKYLDKIISLCLTNILYPSLKIT